MLEKQYAEQSQGGSLTAMFSQQQQGVTKSPRGRSQSPHSYRSPRSPRSRSPAPAQTRGRARERRPPVSPLLKAVKRNAKFELVKKLLDAGCIVDRSDEKL